MVVTARSRRGFLLRRFGNHRLGRASLRHAYCVYGAPSPDSVRRTAERNSLPVDRIAEVRALDPYFHADAPDFPCSAVRVTIVGRIVVI